MFEEKPYIIIISLAIYHSLFSTYLCSVGHIIFQLRERSADYKKRSKRPRAVSQDDLRNHQSDHRHTNVDMLPYLTELNVRGTLIISIVGGVSISKAKYR